MILRKTIALAVIAGGLSFSALAQDEAGVQFSYNPNDTAQEIHTQFLQQARAACEKETGYPSAIQGVYPGIKWACVNELMDEAVSSVNRPELTAVHRDYINPAQPYRIAGN